LTGRNETNSKRNSGDEQSIENGMASNNANHDMPEQEAADERKQHAWFVQTTIFVIFLGFVIALFIWLMFVAFGKRRTRLEMDVPLVALRRNQTNRRVEEVNDREIIGTPNNV
jgi:flagellar biosynthesis/type III secretory pathway M-ring protein FliF/YscJ